MTLEQRLTNLELSKKLKELGVPQESLFYWWGNREETEMKIAYRKEVLEGMIPVGIKEKGYCSAFTATELGEILPGIIRPPEDNAYEIEIHKIYQTWSVNYANRYDNCTSLMKESLRNENEANLRAEMFIYLLENKLITI